MTYTENFFRKIPTKEEKNGRWRKYNLIRAGVNAQEAVTELSKEFFTKQTSKSLMDLDKCVPMLQKIMHSTPHMENLSDFVAICFVYTYIYHQSQKQSIELLKLCFKKDIEFEDTELKLMVKTIIENPPENESDMKLCTQFIAQKCKKSDLCRKFLVQNYQKDEYSQNQANFLRMLRDEVLFDQKNFNNDELQRLNTVLKYNQSLPSKEEVTKKTPTDKIFEKVENKKKVESFYSKIQNHENIIFIIITVFFFLIIIAIV
ncbi:hypothetical protein M9Y10_038961 [Tritrichomonas musculus]|uniref:Uncharacterized protein n=1 Tax=Tritrichomonas musculus TaxID=1915356 RepID=A0ABR2K9U7_9EUKA